jgi:ATP dependent DNA ligase domain
VPRAQDITLFLVGFEKHKARPDLSDDSGFWLRVKTEDVSPFAAALREAPEGYHEFVIEQRVGNRMRSNPVFYAFDLLWLDGDDLRGLPLIERKRRLRRLIRSSRCSRLLFADHIDARGTDLFRAICERDCEGIIAKRKDSISSTAGPAAWFKVLNPAYTQKQGRKELFESFHERQNIQVG